MVVAYAEGAPQLACEIGTSGRRGHRAHLADAGTQAVGHELSQESLHWHMGGCGAGTGRRLDHGTANRTTIGTKDYRYLPLRVNSVSDL